MTEVSIMLLTGVMPVPPEIKTAGREESPESKCPPAGLLTKTSVPGGSSERFFTNTDELFLAAKVILSLIRGELATDKGLVFPFSSSNFANGIVKKAYCPASNVKPESFVSK